jgi:hypothetical protein
VDAEDQNPSDMKSSKLERLPLGSASTKSSKQPDSRSRHTSSALQALLHQKTLAAQQKTD